MLPKGQESISHGGKQLNTRDAGEGMILLVALGKYPDGVGVSGLARDVGLPVSTVHRLLATMVSLGFVKFDAKLRQYSLGLKIFELSQQVSATRRLLEVAVPKMREIVETTGEPCLLAVLDDDEMVYLERIEGRRRIQIWGPVGERGPLHCTSMGKALLAYLPESEREAILSRLTLKPLGPNTITDLEELCTDLSLTLDRGYAVANEEHEEGIRALGVPIINSRKELVAALSIASPAFRSSQEELVKNAPVLRDAAQEIGVGVSKYK